MSQQPFSRPGAVDLSGLNRPTGAAGQGAPAGGGARRRRASYWLDVTQDNFQSTVEASLTAPVLLAFYSPTRLPESAQMAADLAQVAEEFEGRFLAGLVDIDAAAGDRPGGAAAVGAVRVRGDRRAPAAADPGPAAPSTTLRAAVNQVMQQLTAQGITGRHQPRQTAAPGPRTARTASRRSTRATRRPRTRSNASDYDGAVAEYEKLVAANPADTEAAAGLAMARLLQRTKDADPTAARAAADADPDDVAAQTLVADLDLLGGQVDDAFDRLVDVVRRTAGDDRNQAREHLIGLFGAVGNDDPRVLKGRQNLASALF